MTSNHLGIVCFHPRSCSGNPDLPIRVDFYLEVARANASDDAHVSAAPDLIRTTQRSIRTKALAMGLRGWVQPVNMGLYSLKGQIEGRADKVSYHKDN